MAETRQIPDWVTRRMNGLLSDGHPIVDESHFYGLIGKVISTVLNGPEYFQVPRCRLVTGKVANHSQDQTGFGEVDLIPTYVLYRLGIIGRGHGAKARDEVVGIVEFKSPSYPLERAEIKMGDYCRFMRERGKVHEEFRAVLILGRAVYEYDISGGRIKVMGEGEPIGELEYILRGLVQKLGGEDH